MDRTEAVNGLRIVAEHVNDIVTLLDQEDCSLEAIRRIRSVQAELRQIAVALLEGHLIVCVASTVQAGGCCSNALKDIGDLFGWVNKL